MPHSHIYPLFIAVFKMATDYTRLLYAIRTAKSLKKLAPKLKTLSKRKFEITINRRAEHDIRL